MTTRSLFLALAITASGCAAGPPVDPPTQPVPVVTAVAAGYTLVATGKTVGAIPVTAVAGSQLTVTELPNPRQINGDPHAQVPLVLVVRQQQGDWLQVYLPVRPNGSLGLVKASDFTLSSHPYRMLVDLKHYRLQAYSGGTTIFDAPIGVAADNAPTPGGLYYTIELLQPPDPGGTYGPYAYGLSGFSDTLQEFNGGPGQLGIHGTNEPAKIGTKVSHGCIRLRNEDIVRLVNLGMPLGTPVTVQ